MLPEYRNIFFIVMFVYKVVYLTKGFLACFLKARLHIPFTHAFFRIVLHFGRI